MDRKENVLGYRYSTVSKKQVARKGHYFLEVLYGKEVVKSIEVPTNITEQQVNQLVDLTRKELGL